jgi:hypothetical protein
MVSTEDLEPGQLRLLEVDNRVVLPVQTHIRVIITAVRSEGVRRGGGCTSFLSCTFFRN